MSKRTKMLIATTLLAIIVSCGKEEVKDRIKISSPSPKQAITKVSLSDTEQEYVNSGNAFSFSCLDKLYSENTGSMIFSPLSLQYALAMVANGASGDTRNEITSTLGYGEDIDALNTYCNKLLNELPAVDLGVKLKLTDAMIVSDEFPVKDSFKRILEQSYYAPMEYIDASNKSKVVNRINEWASRNTNGLISPFISEDDIKGDFAAMILNALYFEAKWRSVSGIPMFLPEGTKKAYPFYYDGGGEGKVDYMTNSGYLFPYCEQDGFRVLGLPYSSEKFYFYILLPDEIGVSGAQNLIKNLKNLSWKEIVGSFHNEKINLRLPKFSTESRYELQSCLKALGIKKSFLEGQAEFDKLFEKEGYYFWIDKVIQKARIIVEEKGTKAAAVTGTGLNGEDAAEPPKIIDFYVDHPFVYLIAERTSGVILFEGVYTGK